MIINTDRLILRPWIIDDAESLFKYAKNPNVGPIAGWPVHKSILYSQSVITEVLSKDLTFAICLKEDNIAIGSIGLVSPNQSHTDINDDELELGYWIGEPFWGKSYIPEAIKALLDYAFSSLNCSRIWCGHYDGNIKSKKCMEKCGFIYHHTEENKPCVLMSDIRTEHYYTLTHNQWTNLKGT